MFPPTSFIICNIPISYPKRRLFDIFQYKKICIIESIEFIFTDENHLCHASVYVAQWFRGKVCEKFLEDMHIQTYVHFVDDNHCIWKIMPTPKIIEQTTPQKWFRQNQKVSNAKSENAVVKMKRKPREDPDTDDSS